MTAPAPRTARLAPAAQVFRTAEVARILGVSPARIRAIVAAGFCNPVRRGRVVEFSFQDLVVLRAAEGLLHAKVPPRRLRRALAELVRQLAPERPLSGVRIYADGEQVVVRDGRAAWQPESGQIVFSFAVDELARQVRVIRPARQPAEPPRAKPPPAQNAWVWFERALSLEEKDDNQSARAAYERALACDPSLADAYINLGRLIHLEGNPHEAVRLYHLALEHSPDDPVGHYNLALAFEDVRHPAAALAHYQRALACDPHFADAHFNLGRLLEHLGRRAQAMRHMLTYKKLTADS